MPFEWDEGKNRRNVAKHKISLETASLVFDDPWALMFTIASSKNDDKLSV